MNSADTALAPTPRTLLAPGAALSRFVPPANLVSAIAERKEERVVRYGFRIGTLRLLVRPGTGSEVVEACGIAPLPNAPRWLAGMMNQRGTPVPVFDLCTALDLPRGDDPEKAMVLLLDTGERAVGVLIDGFPAALADARPIGRPAGLPARLAPFAPAALATADLVWFEFQHQDFFESLCHAAA